MAPKQKLFLEAHIANEHTKSNVDWVVSCPDGGQKSSFAVIFWPPEGQN